MSNQNKDYKERIRYILDNIPGDWRVYFEAELEAAQALTTLLEEAQAEGFKAGYIKGQLEAQDNLDIAYQAGQHSHNTTSKNNQGSKE